MRRAISLAQTSSGTERKSTGEFGTPAVCTSTSSRPYRSATAFPFESPVLPLPYSS
jgi:hypothetical protein